MNQNLSVFVDVSLKNKDELFEYLSKKALEVKIVDKKEYFLEALNEREKIGSTGLENHIALPHAISDKISKHHIIVSILKKEIKYETLDNSKVKIVICLAVPKNKELFHLDVLQKISVMLLDKKNQAILNEGNVDKIVSIFSEAEKEVKNSSSEVETNENELEINLKLEKSKIKKELKNNQNNSQNLNKSLLEVNEKIDEENKKIKEYKNNFKLQKSNLKNEYEFKSKTIKSELVSEKKSVSQQLKALSNKLSNDKKNLKYNTTNKDEYQASLNKLNYENYLEKAEISKNLVELNNQKIQVKRDYGENKKKNFDFFKSEIFKSKNKLIHPKNLFYKYSDKVQVSLIVLLLVVGLWTIIIGTFGISTYGTFLTVDIKDLLVKLPSSSSNLQTNQIALQNWEHTYVGSNYSLSLSVLIFGAFSLLLIIPLKFLKLSNLIYEKQSIFFICLSTFVLVLTFVIGLLSFKNISSYSDVQTSATQLNSNFSILYVLKDPLKTQSDFHSTSDWNQYSTQIKTQLFSLTGSDELSTENYNKALQIISSKCDEVFKEIILNKISSMNLISNF